MSSYHVKAVPAPGFQHVFRAGYGWPASGLDVEVSADAVADDFGARIITRATFEALRADGRISVTAAGQQAGSADSDALRARIAELEGMLESATAPPRSGSADSNAPAKPEASRARR